jgi:hypothetical protein
LARHVAFVLQRISDAEKADVAADLAEPVRMTHGSAARGRSDTAAPLHLAITYTTNLECDLKTTVKGHSQ